MRALIAAALALLVGVVLGGFGPREELHEAERRIAELEAQDCSPALAGGLASLLAAGAARSAAAPPADTGDRPDAPPRSKREAESARPSAPPDAARPLDRPTPPGARGGDRLDSARAAMDLRRAQARAALIEEAAPDDAQLDALDAAVDEMNDELFVLADEAMARLESGETPERRDVMVFAADALDILITADERLASALDPEQRAAVDEAALDPFSYVDPGLLDLFSSLEGR